MSISGCFDPHTSSTSDDGFRLSVTVLSGRHLVPISSKGVYFNTFVKLEIIGCPVDCAVGMTDVCMVGPEPILILGTLIGHPSIPSLNDIAGS